MMDDTDKHCISSYKCSDASHDTTKQVRVLLYAKLNINRDH